MTAYLMTFFETLGSLTERNEYDVSNAIAYNRGSLYVLISMGDVRARVPVQELDPNPVEAAKEAVDRWKSMSQGELKRAIEEVR
jgi:hypothetical protein